VSPCVASVSPISVTKCTSYLAKLLLHTSVAFADDAAPCDGVAS
jgi:hypothetical protein